MSVTQGNQVQRIPGFHQPRIFGQLETFLISAIAPAAAVVFTNPFDTAKVRLQLQGQSNQSKIYKSSLDALYKIAKNEGLGGLQKGLTPAILREGSKNVFRIGMYDPIMSVIHDPKKGSAPGWKRLLAGSICGMMGALSCNPFELVKTRLQSASTNPNAVGHQHGYSGVVSGLVSIYKQDGVRGLYRGSLLSVGRSIVGSGTNLSAYSMLKEKLVNDYGWEDNVMLDMVCGLASGVVSCVFMNPIDVVRTRYYNQSYINGKGVLYCSGFDAVQKIAQREGVTAFYKGFTTHFLRIGPHFCRIVLFILVTFVFLGILRRGLSNFYGFLDTKDAFAEFDTDGNGTLDMREVKALVEKVLISQGGDVNLVPYYMQRVVQKADKNHDNLISFDEFKELENEIRVLINEKNS